MTDQLRGELRSFLRNVLEEGADLGHKYETREITFGKYCGLRDAIIRERADELEKLLAARGEGRPA